MDETRATNACAVRGANREKSAEAPRGGGAAEMGNALEFLRVACTFLVLLDHAALAYLAIPMRLTYWLAYNPIGHLGFDCFAYWINGFVMPVFFLAAGVSAPAACASRGPRVFLAHRARRLLRPLAFGYLILLIPAYLINGYGLLMTGRIDLDNLLRCRFSTDQTYGLGHFWFLEYLFLVCVLWCGGWTIARRLSRPEASPLREGGSIQRCLVSPWRPLPLAIPTYLIFCLDPETMIRLDKAIVPDLCRLLHYTFFFTVGGWISRMPDPKQRLIPYSALYLGLSVVLYALMLPLLLRLAVAPLAGPSRVLFGVLAALFPWLMLFGGLGVLMRVLKSKGAMLRYLGEASFWVYIVHLPVACLVQILLLPLAWPVLVKFLIVAAVTTAFSLLSYELIVRRSLVGSIINGSRKRSKTRGFFGPEFGWIASLGVMVLVLGGGAWYFRLFLWGNNLYEEVPGQLYRSARLSPRDLDEVLRRQRVRTVITFTGATNHPWFAALDAVCRSREVEHHAVALRVDRLPTRRNLLELMHFLDQCPRPILVQGYQGVDTSGFAVAVALLLRDTSPQQALRQFGVKYGEFGGPEHSSLGCTLLEYAHWLNEHHAPHTADRFRNWSREEYLVHSTPALPDERRPRVVVMARRGEGAAGRSWDAYQDEIVRAFPPVAWCTLGDGLCFTGVSFAGVIF